MAHLGILIVRLVRSPCEDTARLSDSYFSCGPCNDESRGQCYSDASGAATMNFTTAALSLPDSEDKQVVDKGLPDLLQAKQVVVPAGLHPVYEEKQCAHLGGDSDKQAAVGESHTSASTSKVPAVRHKKRWLIGNAVVLLLLIAIILPVSIVVTRNKRYDGTSWQLHLLKLWARSSSPPISSSTPGPSSPPQSDTASPPNNNTLGNALRGTRLAVMDPSTGGDLYLFYQSPDGRLYYIPQSLAHV